MADTTSLTLLEKVRHLSDQESWDRFFVLYRPLIFDWGCRAGFSTEDAADLSQDVLLLLMAELPQFKYSREKGRFRSWLRTVVVNKCRERQRHKIVAFTNREDHISQFEGSSAGNDFWEREYDQYLVSCALQLMQTDFETRVWQAAWKQVVDEQRAADVATELGLSLAATYQARCRVMRHLRQELQDLID